MRYACKKKESLFKRIVYLIALISTLVYIGYRIIFTLPIGLGFLNMFFGIIVVLVELTEAIEFFVYYFNTLRMKKTSPKTPKYEADSLPDVDVFIATINEDTELLSDTIDACLAMQYPDPKKAHIYLCDDGNRNYARTLAKKKKIGYITRTNNKHAKAGNYNHAISVTSSPLIATFDADMKPTPDFLLKTVPFFTKYDNMGFVQAPQSFENPDIFQKRLSLKTPFEQEYFYHQIQLARNNINSTILCGTNCVISREALISAGGYAEETISEDIATGMLIESMGYQGLAIDDIVAYGDAVNEVNGFLKQRSRWGRGCIQTIKRYGVFRNHGLNFRQKLDYFAAINYWAYGIKRFIYMILPLFFAFFGIIVVKCDLKVFLIIFLSEYIIKRFAIDILSGNKRSSVWNKIYELILMPVMAKDILKEVFGLSDTTFNVTPKGKNNKSGHVPMRLLCNHIILLVLNITGIILASINISQKGYVDYILPLVWLGTNSLYLVVALLFDLRNNRKCPGFRPNQIKRYSLKSYLYLIKKNKAPKCAEEK